VTGRRIAVIGSGVSGITAGYALSHNDYVTIFEADGRLGGHADTHLVARPAGTGPTGPPVGVDTGFIVYNERTYPLLTRLFAELGVATQPSEMSMSVRCAGCGLRYAGGRAGLQTITMPHNRMLATRHTYTWMQKYIFPGGLIPSVTAIGDSLARTRLRIVSREDFGAHYAETLRIWREQFAAHAGEVARLGFDEVFSRMWNLYLCYSEAGFRAGYIDVSQLTLARV